METALSGLQSKLCPKLTPSRVGHVSGCLRVLTLTCDVSQACHGFQYLVYLSINRHAVTIILEYIVSFINLTVAIRYISSHD
jgi:hypothetical protein